MNEGEFMAIIALYSSKINQMPNVIEDAKRVNGKKSKMAVKKLSSGVKKTGNLFAILF